MTITVGETSDNLAIEPLSRDSFVPILVRTIGTGFEQLMLKEAFTEFDRRMRGADDEAS